MTRIERDRKIIKILNYIHDNPDEFAKGKASFYSCVEEICDEWAESQNTRTVNVDTTEMEEAIDKKLDELKKFARVEDLRMFCIEQAVKSGAASTPEIIDRAKKL